MLPGAVIACLSSMKTFFKITISINDLVVKGSPRGIAKGSEEVNDTIPMVT